MPYTAEGETIAPAVLQGAEWKTIVSKRHEEFYQRERREAAERRALNALLQPTDSASSPADKAHNNGKYVISRKKTAERKKRPPIPRLPRDDRKIVVRPRNLNLRTIPPGILLATVCAQLNLPMPVIRNEDQLRINPYNNTFTISTPSDERAQLYLNLPGIRINDVDHPVMAYLPAPDNAVRGVIYGALGDESAEEIIELCTIENPKLQILSARRMGQSRAMDLPSLPPPTTTSNRYLLLSSDDDDEDEKDYRDHSEKKEKSRSHRSRTRRRSASRGHSSSRSRDRSASFPPLEEMKKGGSNQSGGRSGNSKTSNSHDNKSEKTSRSRSSSTSSKKADKQRFSPGETAAAGAFAPACVGGETNGERGEFTSGQTWYSALKASSTPQSVQAGQLLESKLMTPMAAVLSGDETSLPFEGAGTTFSRQELLKAQQN
ncbi:hypothetical protein HPB49_008599 [Dermacentor silvarum]|uniref:Uncharacterized protein n=1 Tax=Dermacentor silvarum TaxID=543639 RepID=A0ACB8C8I2_DERSI|nr:hypothetical protein HPB49_008599 [Dermacentor silvarum]